MTGDHHFQTRRAQYDELPEGYAVRRCPPIAPTTSRKMTGGGEAALEEIASVSPRWTTWGEGHSTSMYSGAAERRGYIEVAVPDKPSRGAYLYRATASGVKLANRWRREAGLPLVQAPAAPATPKDLDIWDLHDAIRAEPDTEKLAALNQELARRLDG